MRAESRTGDNRILLLRHNLCNITASPVLTHTGLRHCRLKRDVAARRRMDIDNAHPRAQRSLCRKHCRASHSETTCHKKHPSEIVLVGKRIARLQSVLDSHTVNQIIVRRRLTDSLLAKTDVEHLPLSQTPGILSEEKRQTRKLECQSQVGMDDIVENIC